jgi:MFS family permease
MIKEYIEKEASFHAFRYIDFRRFIFSKFMLTLALQVQFVVLSWQVYQITRDYLALGLLGLAEAIPAVGFALYGGYVADRKDRRKIIILVMAAQFLCSIILMAVSIYYEKHSTESLSVWPFYAIMFGVGLLRGFYSPAQLPLMTQVVPREAYANSSAWNSTFWHIAVVLGSAGGGLLLGFFGKFVTYLIVVIALLIGLIQMIRVSPQPLRVILREEGMLVSIKQGIKFVFGKQVIFGAMLLDLIAVLFGGALALLPVFASEVLNVGEQGFGFLRAAPFVGSVVIALYMTKHPPLKNAGRKLLLCVSCFSLCMIFFALSKNYYLSLFILALSGAFDNVSVVIRSTILQMFTPDEMRGRVASVSTMFISSSNEIGAFESGFAAKLLGLVPSVVVGGGIALASVGVTMFKLPELRKLDLSAD